MRVLCFGDSNTFGTPDHAERPQDRYAAADRWPRVMASALDGCDVIEEALPGRTTDVADPTHPELTGAGMNGAAYLPAALASHMPLDWVVLMLGTNDCKSMFGRSPLRIALGAGLLVDIVQRGIGIGVEYPPPRVLLICPPPPLAAMTHFAEMFDGGAARAAGLAPLYAAVARMAGCRFLDAGEVIATDGADGLHWTAVTQRRFGMAVAGALRTD